MSKQSWRTRTQGTSRQKGKHFQLIAVGKRKAQLPRISGRPSSIHDKASTSEIREFLTKSLMHAKTSPEDYAKYVSGSLHKDVQVTVPSRKVDLSLKVVDVRELPPVNKRRKDFEASVRHIMQMYHSGKTIPPILIHKLPNGNWSILDGNARVEAYKRLGVTSIPAVENSIGETLSHIGKFLGHSINIARGYAGRTIRFAGKAERFGERQAERLGKAVATPSRLMQAYERGRGEPEDATEEERLRQRLINLKKAREAKRKRYPPAL